MVNQFESFSFFIQLLKHNHCKILTNEKIIGDKQSSDKGRDGIGRLKINIHFMTFFKKNFVIEFLTFQTFLNAIVIFSFQIRFNETKY